VLAEAFALLHPNVAVDIQGGGSTAGITAAGAGTASIGMSSRPLRESELYLWHEEIAKDGLAIIVHPSNPLENLTLDQIRGIYTYQITNWSEVGGTDNKIHVITREEGSGTRGAFEELVLLPGMRITPRAIVQDSNGSVRQLVLGDPNSIGFISLGLVNNDVKAVQIDGVAATRENVVNGSYTLFRPFIFISREEPQGYAAVFLDFVLSEEGKRVMALEGLVPN